MQISYDKLIRLNIKKIIGKKYLTKNFLPQKSKNQIHKYWKDPNDLEYNSPQIYLESKTKNTQILVEILNEFCDNKDIKILELGCNAGRNLNKLFENGYKNLYGIEINQNAIKLMQESFPDTFDSTKIFQNSIEDNIKQFKDEEFDVVFSMAVLMHVHYDSNWIFEHIARATKKYVITMEHESGKATKNFTRNYKEIFEKFGLKEIKSFDLEDKYKCRVFTHET